MCFKNQIVLNENSTRIYYNYSTSLPSLYKKAICLISVRGAIKLYSAKSDSIMPSQITNLKLSCNSHNRESIKQFIILRCIQFINHIKVPLNQSGCIIRFSRSEVPLNIDVTSTHIISTQVFTNEYNR